MIEEYSHFVYNEREEKESYADVCKKFNERLVFNQRNQNEGED